MNVQLTNDEYAKLADEARKNGQLTVDLAAIAIREWLNR